MGKTVADWKETGRNIESICSAKNISFESLAKGIGVSKKTLAAWVAGTQKMNIRNLCNLCNFLQITPNDLIATRMAE